MAHCLGVGKDCWQSPKCPVLRGAPHKVLLFMWSLPEGHGDKAFQVTDDPQPPEVLSSFGNLHPNLSLSFLVRLLLLRCCMSRILHVSLLSHVKVLKFPTWGNFFFFKSISLYCILHWLIGWKLFHH